MADLNTAVVVPVTLTDQCGVIWSVCQCGRVFYAKGSRKVCAYMAEALEQHAANCRLNLSE